MAWLSAHHFCPGPDPLGGKAWCFYNLFKLLVTAPSVVASILVGAIVWRRRRKLNEQDPRRARTLADFFDKLVLILFCVDAIGSIPEFFYVFDTQALPLRYYDPAKGMPINTLVYVMLLEGQVMLNAIWHSYMSFVMFAFIVLRMSISRLKRRHSPYKVLGWGLGFVLAYVLLYVGFFYYAKRNQKYYEHMVVTAFAMDIVVFSSCILFMLSMYYFTWQALKERSSEAAFLTGRYVRIRRKLMLITIVIGTALFLGMIGDMLQWIARVDTGPKVSPHAGVSFVAVRVACFRSIGLLDGLIFGGAFDTCLDHQTLLGDVKSQSDAPASNRHNNSKGSVPNYNNDNGGGDGGGGDGRGGRDSGGMLGFVRNLVSSRSTVNHAPPTPAHAQQHQQQEEHQRRHWRLEDGKERASSSGALGDIETGGATLTEAGRHCSFLHVAPLPFGAAGGLRHQSSALPDSINQDPDEDSDDDVDACLPLGMGDVAVLSSISVDSSGGDGADPQQRGAAGAAAAAAGATSGSDAGAMAPGPATTTATATAAGPVLTSPQAVFAWSPPKEAVAKIRVFATTSNVGGCTEVKELGPLEEWIPRGYDLYVIGFQECLMLDALRAAIHEHLGGPGRYEGFVREIGDATILNGMIALTVFARTADVERGAVRVASSAQSRLHSGMKLGPIGRAPNKGMVGLSIRYHDVSIACMTAHFAADKHGKSRLVQRNRDAYRALRELTLTHDDWDFDAHLTHDVLLLLGDLNYRLTAEPQQILRTVAEAAEVEEALWRRRGRPNKDWRTDRYHRLFFPQEARGAAMGRDGGANAGRLPPLLAPEHSIREEEEQEVNEEAASPHGTEGRVSPHGTEGRDPAAQPNGGGAGEASPSRADGTPMAPGSPAAPAVAPRQQRQFSTDSNRSVGSVTGGAAHTASALPVQGAYAMEERLSQDEEEEGGSVATSAATSVTSQGEVLRRYSSFSSMASSALDIQAERPWKWVRECDELSLSMKKGHIFYNFHEAPILFPPSFRWVPGKSGGSFQDPAALESCYTLKAHSKKSGWTLRPPSFTDRVLIHALPDVTPRLRILGYEMCDAIVGSDHRPVSFFLEIRVNSTVLGFNEIAVPEARRQRKAAIAAANHRPPAAAAAATSSLLTPASPGRPGGESDGWPHHEETKAPPQQDAADGGPGQALRPRAASLEEAALTSASAPDLPPEMPQASKSMSHAIAAAAPSTTPRGIDGNATTTTTTSSTAGDAKRMSSRTSFASLLPRLVWSDNGDSGPGNVPTTPLRLPFGSRNNSGTGDRGDRGRPSEATGQALVKRMHQHSSRWLVPAYDGPLAVWAVELTHLRLVGHEVDLPDMEEITVQFPVSTEDPIARERKSLMLDESFMDLKRGAGGGAGGGTPNPSGAEGALAAFLRQKQQYQPGAADTFDSTASGNGTAGGGPDVAAMDVITSIHRISYRRMALQRDREQDARGLSMRVSAVVAPAFTRHLLVKIIDPKGRDIGQGALSLKDACAVPPGDNLLVPLSLGGEPRYVFLALRCRVREERAYRQRAAPSATGGAVAVGQAAAAAAAAARG